MEERRREPRRDLDLGVRVAAAPEQRLPRGRALNISRNGLLVAFEEPVGLPSDHRLVVSLDLGDGHFHALGRVVRTERGDDFRTYVAVEFVSFFQDDFDELTRRLDADG
ncbi:MAG: hypothetical protein JWL72_4692 [Ilumatobacteraceae bacterium]|nr:hypothetical protein [Ilumatobacteraceae bacterium]